MNHVHVEVGRNIRSVVGSEGREKISITKKKLDKFGISQEKAGRVQMHSPFTLTQC